MTKGGIFCLEGQWHRDLRDRGSVLPTLNLLERLERIRFIHRDVATSDELNYFLSRWGLRQYSDYQVGFFAMHGDTREVWLTDSLAVPLRSVGEQLAGRCGGRRLYFAACSVMRGSDQALHELLEVTGAVLVCGYTKQIDWVESAAFETVLLDVLANEVISTRVDV